MSARWNRWIDWLSQPVAGQSLAVTRILFGAIMLWDCYRYIDQNRIYAYYIAAPVNFPYFGLDFIRPLPEPWIWIAWGTVGVSGALVALGLFYRVAIIALLLSFGYFFLLDRVQYLNHNYMILLYAALLALAPANRMWSLDARLGLVGRSPVIPRWPVAAIRLQTEIILIYAGLVKITDDWLRGEPLRIWLPAREDQVLFGFLFQYEAVIVGASWGVVALHVLGAPLLLWRRTRLAVFLLYVGFHLSNVALFNIGVFPWLTIAVTLIFFDPDWPSRLWRRLRHAVGTVPAAAPSVAAAASVPRLSTALFGVFIVWFAVQLFLPMRQALFPNLVGWTGDGHRFSWRMRIYDRDTEGGFIAVNTETGEAVAFQPKELFGSRSGHVIMSRPDIAYDFAHWLEARLQSHAGWPGAEVYPSIRMSLNGRPLQEYFDPTVDLTEAEYRWLRPNVWVMPLETRAAEGVLPDWFPPLPLQKP